GAKVGRMAELGLEHVDDPLQGLALAHHAFLLEDAGGVAGDVDQEHPPHRRIIERAREGDRQASVEHERAQHLYCVVAADRIGRDGLLLGDIVVLRQARYVTALAASITSRTDGSASFSRLAAYGIGTSLPVTFSTGASRKSNASVMISDAMNEEIEATGHASSTMTHRLVFFTESTTLARS